IGGETLSAFLRWAGFGFLFAGASADADFSQERLHRLFATEEFFNRNGRVASIALFVNFMPQPQTGLLVEITVLGFFENSSHVGGDRIGPGVTVVAGVVAVHVTEIGHERRAGIDWQKNSFEDRIRDRDAIIRLIFGMNAVHR